MSTQATSKLSSLKPALPLDWGFGFVSRHRRSLILFTILPLSIELLSAGTAFYSPLKNQHRLLLLVLTVFSHAWLLSVITQLVVEDLKHSSFRLSLLAVRALQFLPKVVLSYFGLVGLVLIALQLFQPSPLPLLLLLVFFVWAPFYCVGELFIEEPRIEDDADDYEDEYTSDDTMFKPKPTTAFKRKGWWELGYARSLELTSKEPGLTLQIVLFYWAVEVLPQAFVDAVADSQVSFWPLALKIVFATLGSSFVIALAASAFVLCLKREDQEALGITTENIVDRRILPDAALPQVQGKPFVLIGLALITGASTFVWAEGIQSHHRFPDTAKMELVSAVRKNSELILTATLDDSERRFRWLIPNRFFLSGLETEPESVAPELTSPSPAPTATSSLGGLLEASLPEEDRFLRPIRWSVFDTEGEPLSGDMLAPHYGPLKIVLVFAVPDESSKGPITLAYVSPHGKSQQLVDDLLSFVKKE